MLPRNHPDRIQITFDDHRLVNNAGLLLPATLALNLGLRQLVDHHLDLGDAPGRANAGDKMMTLIASALAGGDCIDDADALRAGGTAGVLDCTVKAPSTLGTFLRSFRWGHVRQLDRVSRELLARAWAAGAVPGDASFTIDLDSTICETYGLAKEGARHHGYTGQRGYHPLLAVAAGPGDVLLARLREGQANTARGAAHFLRETVGRVRHAGAKGQLTMRADSGFYTHGVVSACRKLKVRFSITIRQRQSLRNLIEAIPEMDREQMWLLPPSLDELLPLDHPARFVAEFVDVLDKEGWAELGVEIEGDPLGAPAYHPRALLCVWLYGFMTGVRSCRKLEAACRDQISYLWLTGWQHPDHNTLWRFYKIIARQ